MIFPPTYSFWAALITLQQVKKITHSAERLLKEYRGAVAAKTGYTRAAGFNGVLLAEKENERIITVVFGCKSTTTMITQISKLTDLGFRKTPSN